MKLSVVMSSASTPGRKRSPPSSRTGRAIGLVKHLDIAGSSAAGNVDAIGLGIEIGDDLGRDREGEDVAGDHLHRAREEGLDRSAMDLIRLLSGHKAKGQSQEAGVRGILYNASPEA